MVCALFKSKWNTKGLRPDPLNLRML